MQCILIIFFLLFNSSLLPYIPNYIFFLSLKKYKSNQTIKTSKDKKHSKNKKSTQKHGIHFVLGPTTSSEHRSALECGLYTKR